MHGAEKKTHLPTGPVFKPEPGWGGQLNEWLRKNFSKKILPTLAIIVFIFGLFQFINRNQTNNTGADEEKTLFNTTSQLEASITVTANIREGITHLARKALSEYAKNNSISLNAIERLYVETVLTDNHRNTKIDAGDAIAFSIAEIKNAIEKSRTLTKSQILKLKQYLR